MPQIKWFLPALVFLILLVTLVLDQRPHSSSVADQPTLVAETPSAKMLERGQLDFSVYCATCHGPNAQGLPGLGPNLTSSVFVHSHSNEALVSFIIQGRPIDDPANQSGVAMPPRAGFPRLTDEAIRSIIAYIRTLSTETSS